MATKLAIGYLSPDGTQRQVVSEVLGKFRPNADRKTR